MSPPKKRTPAATVELTQRALADLREIERYSVKTWGRKTADKYLDQIAAALDRLRANPEILRLEPDLAPGVSFYRVQKHVLACSWRPRRVVVLTVVHASMDLPARLQELEPRLAAEAEFLHEKLRRHRPDS